MATKYYSRVKPKVMRHNTERIARQHREAHERVKAHWQPKIESALKRRDRAVRTGNHKAYRRHQKYADSLQTSLLQELGLIKRLLGSKSVNPKTGETKHGIRRG